MKTTIEIPDDLYRKAKSEAALHGRKLKDLVEEGLRSVLERPKKAQQGQNLAEIMKGACGIMDSGISDYASNPKHLEGFGRDARRHR